MTNQQNNNSKSAATNLPAHSTSDEIEIQKIVDEIDNQEVSLPERAWNIFVDIALVVVFCIFLPISAIAWQAGADAKEKYDTCLKFDLEETSNKRLASGGFEQRFKDLTQTMSIDVELAIQSWGFFGAFGSTLIVFGVVYALWKAGYLYGSPPAGKTMSVFNLTRFVFRATLSLGSCVCLLTMAWPMYLSCQTTSCLQGLLVRWADDHFWAVRFVALKLKFGRFSYNVPPFMSLLQKGLFLLIPMAAKKVWSSIEELHSQQKFMGQEQVTLQEGLGRLNDRIEDVQQIAQDVGDSDEVRMPNRDEKKAARTTLIELSKLGLLQDHMKWFDKNQVQPFFHDPDQNFIHMTPDAKQPRSRLSMDSVASSQLNFTPGRNAGGGGVPMGSVHRASSAPSSVGGSAKK